MAVFFDTGCGDIYAGLTREAVVAAMLEDNPETELDEIVEVSGAMKMCVTNEDKRTHSRPHYVG